MAGTTAAAAGESAAVRDVRTLPEDETRALTGDVAGRTAVQQLLAHLRGKGFSPDRARARAATVGGETRRQVLIDLDTPTGTGDARLRWSESDAATEVTYFPSGSRSSADELEVVRFAIDDGAVTSERETVPAAAELKYCHGPNDSLAGVWGYVIDIPDICDICWECEGEIDWNCVKDWSGILGASCAGLGNYACAALVFFSSGRALDDCCSEGGRSWLDCCNIPVLC